jgi:hypothetical protein
MADTAAGNGAGAASDALNAMLEGAIEGVRHAPVEPGSDPRVAAAFALGWQMAEFYRPGSANSVTPTLDNHLPDLDRFGADDRGQISILQVRAALARLSDTITAAKLTMPDPTTLFACFDGTAAPEAQAAAVRDLHVKLLATLTAADFRLGKAYRLGRALADMCRVPTSPDQLKKKFAPSQVARLQSWLCELTSAFPPHAAKSVRSSLGSWSLCLETQQGDVDDAVATIESQGRMWRSLLSGEKCCVDNLTTSDYIEAAGQMLHSIRRLALSFIRHFPVLVTLIVVLFAGGVALMWASASSGSVAAGAAGVLASVGLTWKGLGSSIGDLVGRGEQQLWGAEIDHAVSVAITLWPADTGQLATRPASRSEHVRLAKVIAGGTTRGVTPPTGTTEPHTVNLAELAASPRPEVARQPRW